MDTTLKHRPLAGQVAIVTGASRGIALELGAAGATVYVTGRSTRAQPATTYGQIMELSKLSELPGNIDDTADEVYNRVMARVHDGAIVELHLDGPATDQSTALALPSIIHDLEARGYRLVTVPEILLPCPTGP